MKTANTQTTGTLTPDGLPAWASGEFAEFVRSVIRGALGALVIAMAIPALITFSAVAKYSDSRPRLR